MMMEPAIGYLRGKEWSMGNGQCPDCHGVPESSHGSLCHPTSDTIGHKADCALALALCGLGEEVVFLGGYKSDVVYESYWDECGLLEIREKEKRNVDTDD